VIDQLRKDAIARPDLFHFFGAIGAEKLEAWLRRRRLVVPDDLKEFWCETGGGDLFESETVLGPFGPVETRDDLDSMNPLNGIPLDWLVFHTGLGLTMVKMSSAQYANVREGSYTIRETFGSLDEWLVAHSSHPLA
jgi:hypothetical protein